MITNEIIFIAVNILLTKKNTVEADETDEIVETVEINRKV